MKEVKFQVPLFSKELSLKIRQHLYLRDLNFVRQSGFSNWNMFTKGKQLVGWTIKKKIVISRLCLCKLNLVTAFMCWILINSNRKTEPWRLTQGPSLQIVSSYFTIYIKCSVKFTCTVHQGKRLGFFLSNSKFSCLLLNIQITK